MKNNEARMNSGENNKNLEEFHTQIYLDELLYFNK
jgi:hypothetical protein